MEGSACMELLNFGRRGQVRASPGPDQIKRQKQGKQFSGGHGQPYAGNAQKLRQQKDAGGNKNKGSQE